MLRLGLWQWHRAESASGGIQNYAYAFQWPIFAVLAIVLWVKTLQYEVRRDPDSDEDDRPLPQRVDADIFLIEIKAAAIDVVAEAALERGAECVFAINDIRPLESSVDLDAELLALADAAMPQPVAG
jgi:hypothetical protein